MFMFEKAIVGGRRYWVWLLFLAGVILAGFLCYLRQLTYGLGITGLSRDVTWGLYIAQFTFFVGVAASAVIFASASSDVRPLYGPEFTSLPYSV